MIDLKGMRFGKLEALSYEGASRWLCRCDCGVVKSVLGASLREGVSRSCGCSKRENRHSPRSVMQTSATGRPSLEEWVAFGQTHSLTRWARLSGLATRLLRKRLDESGGDLEAALNSYAPRERVSEIQCAAAAHRPRGPDKRPRAPYAQRVLAAEETEKIREMIARRDAGEPLASIGASFGVTRTAIDKRIRRWRGKV